MAYANGFTLWNYATSDTLAVVKGSGYFNEIAPFARVGDMVWLMPTLAAASLRRILFRLPPLPTVP